MKEHTVNKNVLTHKGIIVQQVNCQGVMGAGLALQIKNKWSKVYKEYKLICNITLSKELLGSVQCTKVSDDTYVANIFSQEFYGRGKLQTDYKAMTTALKRVAKLSRQSNLPVGIPYKIGCGLAGGDWSKVSSIISKELKDIEYNIYKL